MPQLFDRNTFFAYARRSPFGNRLTGEQVNGLEAMLIFWERSYPNEDIRKLAYVLATVFHETGSRMTPVREGFASSDAAARKITANRVYGKPDVRTNQSYYGRGYVQLTWYENYNKFSKKLGIDLVKNPDLALDSVISLKILFTGMMEGLFTGKGLDSFFSPAVEDPEGARRIINGTDKKSLIANYYKQFLAALNAAKDAVHGETPADVHEDSAEPDGANLFSDRTMIGGVTTAAGGIAASLISAISNPWALAAFAVVAVGVFLVVTGRIAIKTKAGA